MMRSTRKRRRRCRRTLHVIDQAIAESRAALKAEPQSAPARNSLFGALKAKVRLLQDTIALMNQMRKGDAAGAAQVVDSVEQVVVSIRGWTDMSYERSMTLATSSSRSSWPRGQASAQDRMVRDRLVVRDRVTVESYQGRDRDQREQQTERVTRTLKVGQNGEVHISNISGDIIGDARRRKRGDAGGRQDGPRPNHR